MQATRDAAIVGCLVVLALSPVMVGLLAFPTGVARDPLAPFCPGNPSPYYNSVNLTSQSPVLLPELDRYGVAKGPIGFHLDAPADLSGAWNATAPISFGVGNVSAPPCLDTGLPGAGHLNGTFNITLFPGNYVIALGWSYYEGSPTVTVTRAWVAAFDLGLDVLQTPKEIALAPHGYAAWTVSAPSRASHFFVEYALVTDSCSFELAMLPASAYRAFLSGQGPLNANGTEVIGPMPGGPPAGPCGPNSGGVMEDICETGPYNWTSRDVVVFFNAADSGAGLNLFAPLEVSYLSG